MAGNSYFDEKQVKHFKTKRIISFALAAALILSLGIAAYAAFSSMTHRVPKKSETFRISWEEGPTGYVEWSDAKLAVTFPETAESKEIEFRPSYLPDEMSSLQNGSWRSRLTAEKLGGKLYTDGGFVDSLPLHALVVNGYKDIIAVRIPGMGWERRFRMPEDVNVTTIHTNSDLGFVLNFDAEQSRRDMAIGYLDAQRVLYGLYGQKYYIDRSMTDREALEWLLDHCAEEGENLRTVCEKELPRLARKLNAEDGDYYELMAAKLEQECANRDIDNMRIYTDKELIALVG